MHWKDHLRRAVAIKGSQDALAKAIGCSQGKISWLLVTGKPPAAEDAMAIERATNGLVLKSQLRPDIWQQPDVERV